MDKICVCGNRKQVPEVGGITVSEETERMKVIGGDTVPVNVIVYGCPECGFQWTDSEAEDARTEAYIQWQGKTIKRLKAALKRYGCHLETCACVDRMDSGELFPRSDWPCDCGFNEAHRESTGGQR